MIAAIIFPIVRPARIINYKRPEISTIKQIALGFIMYAADFDDKLPPTSHWDQRLAEKPYIKSYSLFDNVAPRRCAMNVFLSEGRMTEFDQPENTVLVFVSNATEYDAAGGYELRAVLPKNGSAVIGFLDGHVNAKKRTEFAKSIWVSQMVVPNSVSK